MSGYDLKRGSLDRLTFSPAQESEPVWTPDGRRIVFRMGEGAGERPTCTGYVPTHRRCGAPHQQPL